ncbi:MAG: hypothetical protein ACE5JA_10385 [bacterium]
MKALARVLGWLLVPVLAVGKAAGRLLPKHGYGRQEVCGRSEALDWAGFVRSYKDASKDVVKWWLEGDGYTLNSILTSEVKKETARDLMFNLMSGVREGFIDPEFARCLTYALSCAVIEQGAGNQRSSEIPSPAWACEYCVLFEGLKEVLLPDPESPREDKRRGNKLGVCERRGRITMRQVRTSACEDFTLERRKHLKLLKQANEELQLWYLVHRHQATEEELIRIKDFRNKVKTQIHEKLKERRKQRRTDHSFR